MWTKQITSLAQYFAFDAIVAIFVGLAWDSQKAFIFIVALYSARFSLMIYKAMRQLVAYFIFGEKRIMTRQFTDVLSAGDFPTKREIWQGATDYLAGVRQNKVVPVNTRCAAAELGGYFEGQKLVAPLSAMLQMHAFEQALYNYATVATVGPNDAPEFEEN